MLNNSQALEWGGGLAPVRHPCSCAMAMLLNNGVQLIHLCNLYTCATYNPGNSTQLCLEA